MKGTDLVVSINATFQWNAPPKDKQDEMLRDQANMKMKRLARKLERSVQLILLEMATVNQ